MTDQLQKDREEALLAAEAAMALRMKDGLAEYKRGFGKRVSAFAAVFLVGAAVGAWLFGGSERNQVKADWTEWASLNYKTNTGLYQFDPTRMPEWIKGTVHEERILNAYESGETFHLLDLVGEQVLVEWVNVTHTDPIFHYMRHTDYANLSEPVIGLRYELSSATWTKNGFEHLLIGDVDIGLISRLADGYSAY